MKPTLTLFSRSTLNALRFTLRSASGVWRPALLVLLLMVGGCGSKGEIGLILPDAKNCVSINNEYYDLKWSVDIEVDRESYENTYKVNGVLVNFSHFSDSLSNQTQDIFYQSHKNGNYPFAILRMDRNIKMKDFWPIYNYLRESGIFYIYHDVECESDPTNSRFIPQTILKGKGIEYQKQINSMY